MNFPCSCPPNWPRLIEHSEDGQPITIVKHHGRCLLASVRVSGVHLPPDEYELRVRTAIGEKPAALSRGG